MSWVQSDIIYVLQRKWLNTSNVFARNFVIFKKQCMAYIILFNKRLYFLRWPRDTLYPQKSWH
jgi:hypothetical protein